MYSNRSKAKLDVAQVNPNNILITKVDICNILRKSGVPETDIRVNNISTYIRATTHRSYLKQGVPVGTDPTYCPTNCVPLQENSFERLEFLGDLVLSMSIGTYLYDRYPDQNEGFMTKLKTQLVRDKTCAKLCRRMGLKKYVLISNYLENTCHGRNNKKIQEDMFEAFLGAVYTDYGSNGYAYEICKQMIVNLYETHIDIISIIYNDQNYKDILLRYYQRNFKGAFPTYTIISERSHTGVKIYEMGVLDITGKIIGVGKSSKKIDAEQSASKDALMFFKVPIIENSDSESNSESD